MRDSGLHTQLRRARLASGLSQAALAARSGAGRVTIARLETGTDRDFRLGTLLRLCEALGLELAALPRGALPAQETLLARERERSRGLELRRRHAALAARLLAAPASDAATLIRQARSNVDRWARDDLCSEHYISRWRRMLRGSARRVALSLLERDDWTDALFRNSPWGFAFGDSAR